MILYSYFRSSAAYRVRIALNLKGLKYDIHPIHLLKDGGQQHLSQYQTINPLELVPVLTHNNLIISQSLAIIDYLEEIHSSPTIYPNSIQDRIACKEIALSISCDIHPINNLRVINFLKEHHKLSAQHIKQWSLHWIDKGFCFLEEKLKQQKNSSGFCFGNQPSLADICLIPQVYNGLRHDIDMSAYSRLNEIYQHCITLPEFKTASPEFQPDAPRN